MGESVQDSYRVVLYEPTAPNELGEMTEMQLYGFLGTRLSEDTAHALLDELEKKGAVTTYFDHPLKPRTRVEIWRVIKSEAAR